LCPLGIDTGSFIKELRFDQHSLLADAVAAWVADHFSATVGAMRALLAAGHMAQAYLGYAPFAAITRLGRRVFGRLVPEWNSWIPLPASPIRPETVSGTAKPVVYFPSCVSRIFGVSNFSEKETQTQVIERLFKRAGFRAVYPPRLKHLCCGMAFASKGFFSAAQQKTDELTSTLDSVSQGGPIVLDTSPCAARLRTYASQKPELRIYDLSQFLVEKIVPQINIRKTSRPIAVHVPCSLKGSQEDQRLLQLARLCAENVHTSESAPCCGFAGDRGFTYPELAASALVRIGNDLPPGCLEGYSSSRTCELGVSIHSGITFRSIAYLLDEVST